MKSLSAFPTLRVEGGGPEGRKTGKGALWQLGDGAMASQLQLLLLH